MRPYVKLACDGALTCIHLHVRFTELFTYSRRTNSYSAIRVQHQIILILLASSSVIHQNKYNSACLSRLGFLRALSTESIDKPQVICLLQFPCQ